MLKKLLVVSLLLGLVVGLVVGVRGAEEESKLVQAKGVAALSGDVGKARELAIADAQRNAVEQALGTFVNSETLVENYVTVKDEIYTKASGFIGKYDLVDEGKNESEGTYWVEIAAEVGKQPLMEKLKALGILREWRIMVMVPEYHANWVHPETDTLEMAVSKKLIDAGYFVVDKRQTAKIRDSETAKQMAKGNVAAATKLAKRFGADIIVSGQAFAEKAGEMATGGYAGMNMNFKSVRITADIRVIRTDTGEMIDTAHGETGSADISEWVAAKKGMNQLGEELGAQVATSIAKIPASPTQNIQLVVTGWNYEGMQTLEQAVKALQGVKKTALQEFEGNVGRLDIEYTGKSKQLADQFTANASLKGLALKVEAVSGNRIDLEK